MCVCVGGGGGGGGHKTSVVVCDGVWVCGCVGVWVVTVPNVVTVAFASGSSPRPSIELATTATLYCTPGSSPVIT